MAGSRFPKIHYVEKRKTFENYREKIIKEIQPQLELNGITMKSTHKLKKQLVNHGGIIQWKIIIRDMQDLENYVGINNNQFAGIFEEMLTEKIDMNEVDLTNKHKTAIMLTAQTRKVSVLEAVNIISREKMMGMLKSIQSGYTLVVSEAGGYTHWDDRCMQLVEETAYNLKLANADNEDDEFKANVSICKGSPVLVLENSYYIPEKINDYVEITMGCAPYSYAKNLRFANGRTSEYIKDAIKNGCTTIVAATTMQNVEQVNQLCALFEKLPGMSFHLLVYGDFNKSLIDAVGETRAAHLLSKHKIKIIK